MELSTGWRRFGRRTHSLDDLREVGWVRRKMWRQGGHGKINCEKPNNKRRHSIK